MSTAFEPAAFYQNDETTLREHDGETAIFLFFRSIFPDQDDFLIRPSAPLLSRIAVFIRRLPSPDFRRVRKS
ncbi:MAG: hypothetical protein IKG04_05600 [Exiguobacterium sp.]|nr:hypothetical protein [Exiguobacterium sp.]